MILHALRRKINRKYRRGQKFTHNIKEKFYYPPENRSLKAFKGLDKLTLTLAAHWKEPKENQPLLHRNFKQKIASTVGYTPECIFF